MATRADRIIQILHEAGGRLRFKEIRTKLAEMEGAELKPMTVYACVRQDNNVRAAQGKKMRFKTLATGDEDYGFISLREMPERISSLSGVIKNPEAQLPVLIEKANTGVKEELRNAIKEMSWYDFESNFLTQVLEALGFGSVEITAPTKDGGTDAHCTYKRGIVTSEAIVSAKHWTGKKKVSVDEVQRVRGIIAGAADTGIIVSFSGFTEDAKKEAKQVYGRSVVPIDGDLLVEICFRQGIGVRPVKLPTLLKFTGFETEETGAVDEE